MNAVSWGASFPAEWPRTRIKHVGRFAGGGTPDKGNTAFWNGDIPWVSPKDMKSATIDDTEDHITREGLQSSATKLVAPGAVLLVMRSGILRHTIPVAINRVPVALNQDMRAITPLPWVEARFLARLLEGHQQQLLTAWSKVGSTVESLESDLVGETEIAIPPLPLQRIIADHLDRETARLDALVAAKVRVLGLLAEKRRALITRAVTRGLDPRASLRESGIPWLGEIPAHWETERTRWLFKERDQRSTTGEEELLSVSHITGVTRRSEKDVNMFEAETTEGYKICLTGDLVINTLWAWMGAMGVAPVDGIASPAYNVYEPGNRVEPSYIDALVRLPVFAQEVTRYSKGVWSSRLRLYPEGFFEAFLPVPSLSEQRAIVANIAKETAKLDELRAATERTIALLKERRAALISAAVTGRMQGLS
ncbi:MAG: restriction endonuclease subunit S [Candidatus Peribacteraceae bacterium]|nr:restriction endonuclease subunit S [Candidatus Peribacteraceae bacterium]